MEQAWCVYVMWEGIVQYVEKDVDTIGGVEKVIERHGRIPRCKTRSKKT